MPEPPDLDVAAPAPVLELRGVRAGYGRIQVLHGIDLTVPRGKVVGLLGPNGAGKSTTLGVIGGHIRPTGGAVTMAGRDVTGAAPDSLARAGVCTIPEGRGIFANLSVDENLDLGAFIRRDRAAVARDREHALELFPRLRERLGQNAGTLSGGEQQMLAIARALLARPKLLLLDEPSLGLAPQLVQTIFKIIREINQEGTTILLVEQNAHMALQVAHHGYVLEVGQLVQSGKASDLASDDQIRKAYLGVHD